ncbi:MAG: CHAT domain-containing protein [bacterium]
MKTTISWFTIILPGIMIQMIPECIEAQPMPLPEDVRYVQSHLNEEEVMLEYNIFDSVVQVSAIANESTMSVRLSLNKLFWISLKSFRYKLKSADPIDFLTYGEILYQFLIKPVRDFLKGRHRLIIITDDRLAGLPFEALIRRDSMDACSNLCNLHYLIHDFEVVYHCSMVSWNERVMSRGSEHSGNPDDYQFAFMGFSPAGSKQEHYTPLPRSRSEIASIGSLFRQKGLSSWLVYDEEDGKKYFKERACRGKIVHLATHYMPEGTGNGAGGFLFNKSTAGKGKKQRQESLLTIDEIKILQLDADLVVLNACGSAVERFSSETPRISLPALLFMAGARNILATLWNVTDNLAEHFMLDFYRLWLSGKTYSAALREVKLQWINCNSTTIPTIWAPYVLMGE